MINIMPTRRPHLSALLAAIAVLVPGAAAGGGVDVQLTSAIPMPGLQDGKQSYASADVARLKSGLDALAGKDIPAARAVRDGLPANSLDRHILAWAIALYGGDQVPSGEIADAAEGSETRATAPPSKSLSETKKAG